MIPLIYLKSTTDPDIAPRLLVLSIVALIFSVFVLADKAFSPLTTIDARSLPIFIYRGMANKAYVFYQRHQYKQAYLTLLSHSTDNQKKDYKMLMRAIKRHIDK